MADDSIDRWPTFELVTIPQNASLPPELAAQVKGQGVPKGMLGYYWVASEWTLQVDARIGLLLRFGTVGRSGTIGLNPSTEEVVEVVNVPGGHSGLVNSSLQQFIELVRIVIERFPFYGNNSDLEERQHVGNELAEAVQSTDPVALEDVDGFWQTFIDDVVIGDYTIEDVIGQEGT